MRFFRRSLINLGIAAMLPTVVFAASGVYYFLRAERERVETATLGRSEIVMMLVDARLRRDLAALNVLTSSVDLETGNWPELHGRVERVLRANTAWTTIALLDLQEGRQIFDLRHPFTEQSHAQLAAHHLPELQQVRATAAASVGSIVRDGQPVIWIYAPVAPERRVRYVLAAALKAQVFQDLLLALAEPGTTAGIVDRHGNFVARTLDYENRVGTPATRYVRDSIRNGTRGVYQGTTWEGLKSYTAFYMSSWSRWSAHLAVASSVIDTPTVWSFVAAALAGLGALLLGGFLVVLVLRDMAERRHAEETLRQSQKMEAVGQLTGGIAHDFNNLLTAIIGNLDLIRDRLNDERLRRMADNALEAARRGAKLSSQLLAFSRSQRMTVGPVDLQQLLNGMHSLLTQSVGPTIEVRLQVDPEVGKVVSDANQLELALLNLAVNARDAMPRGGQLTIAVRRAEAIDGHLPKGHYAQLCITDTGTGMTEEVRARAIEPFFTTKAVGHGTGLGLSQVYAVARESGGALHIDSAVGRGTSVCLTLPLAPQLAITAPVKLTDRTQPLQQRAATAASILVVDDDTLVRRFMSESLRSLGYEVVDASGGAQALDILDRQRFDLLLLDFAMPGMTGAEVASAAQAKYPDLAVLIVSGYADSAAVEAALGSARQLRKPFDMAELSASVAEVLRQRGPAAKIPPSTAAS